ncbi:MAG: FG-GAP-like repeat-containing protein [Acidobacteriota bacterium]
MTLHWSKSLILTLAAVTGSTLAADQGEALPKFTDVTEQAGIHFKHSFGDFELTNIVEGTGAGACAFDYDGDGWLDIYFVNGAWDRAINDNRGRKLRGTLFNALYHNNHDGTFTDVTDHAGVSDPSPSFGCSAADYDGDGDLDLYVLNYGPNVLYRNNGDGTFTDVSEASGLAREGAVAGR